jgi:hypothetical protein
MLGPKVGGATRGEPPRYVAIHEVDDVKGFFEGPEFDAAWSELTKRIVKDAKAFVVRGWEKIEALDIIPNSSMRYSDYDSSLNLVPP